MKTLVIDVETLGDVNDYSTLKVYDIGFAVVDTKAGILAEYQFIIREFFDTQDFETAYYYNKRIDYYNMLANNNAIMISFLDARNRIADIIKQNKIKVIFAFNAKFDMNALNNTTKILSNGFTSSFMPYGTEYRCIQLFAANVLANKRYGKFCAENGLYTDKGNIRTTAEAFYSYLSNNAEYKEAHTGLEDVKIEVAILLACFKTHKRFPKNRLFGNAWQVATKNSHIKEYITKL